MGRKHCNAERNYKLLQIYSGVSCASYLLAARPTFGQHTYTPFKHVIQWTKGGCTSLVQFLYLVFTCTPGESYCRHLRVFVLYLCYVFRAPINSLVCWCDLTVSHVKHIHSREKSVMGWVVWSGPSFPIRPDNRQLLQPVAQQIQPLLCKTKQIRCKIRLQETVKFQVTGDVDSPGAVVRWFLPASLHLDRWAKERPFPHSVESGWLPRWDPGSSFSLLRPVKWQSTLKSGICEAEIEHCRLQQTTVRKGRDRANDVGLLICCALEVGIKGADGPCASKRLRGDTFQGLYHVHQKVFWTHRVYAASLLVNSRSVSCIFILSGILVPPPPPPPPLPKIYFSRPYSDIIAP